VEDGGGVLFQGVCQGFGGEVLVEEEVSAQEGLNGVGFLVDAG